VRFAAEAREGDGPRGVRGKNGYAGSPPIRNLGPFLSCTVECRGTPDPATGYLLNIREIDLAVHARVRPMLERACADPASDPTARDPADLLAGALDAIQKSLPVTVTAIELGLSPYHALSMTTADTQHATIRLRFDFAAAHRLHVAAWTDEANRDYFGKCNNPNGHGHNYQLEVRVLVPARLLGAFSIDALEAVVESAVIERFDHKHLNLDTEEFADGTGLNPTVENIARVCHGLLTGPIAGLGERLGEGLGKDAGKETDEGVGGGVWLHSVRVWETDRTSSEYPA